MARKMSWWAESCESAVESTVEPLVEVVMHLCSNNRGDRVSSYRDVPSVSGEFNEQVG